MITPPSGYRIEAAMSAWQSARARLLIDDADLAHDEAALEALLGTETGDVNEIITRLVLAAQHAAAMDDAAATMIENLKARRDRYKRRAEQFRASTFAVLDAMGQRRFETAAFTVSVAAGRPAAHITDEDALEDRFIKVTTERKVDRAAVLTALKDGEVIEGAMLTNSLPVLTVRNK